MDLLRIPLDVTGSRKAKMAVAKPEVLISQLVFQIATRFQRLPQIFGVQQLEEAIANAARCSRKSESKMAVAKPEVLIAQLVG